ncbi:MAG: GC-type dockerin domain-anchored protein [Planctomycetota bacterium]
MKFALHTAALAGILGATTAQAQNLRVIPLGSLGGQSAAWAFDGVGRVVCVSATEPKSNLFHPMLSDGTNVQDLGVLPGTTNAFGFAASGDTIFGMSYSFQDLTIRALRWQNGVMGTIGDFAPRGANESGQVVGFLNAIVGTLRVEHACLWSAGTLTDLGTLGGNHSWGYDINAAGWIVGSSMLARDAQSRACLWVNGVPRDLGTLGGADGQAYAINNPGVVVGWSKTSSGEKHATAWNLDASGNVLSRTDLGLLAGWSYAYGVNHAGDIVGTSNSKAVVWRGGVITDLNTTIMPGSGWRLDVASAIDDLGRICGWGTLDGMPMAYLLVCRADFNGDGAIDFFDYDAFVVAFEAGAPGADFDGDGAIDFFDYDAFVRAFEAGC